MQVKSIAECSKGSILQYFQPSLSYHLSFRSLFCLFLSGCVRHVLLNCCSSTVLTTITGGITMILAMPNTNPPAVDEASFTLTQKLARSGARCDYAVYLGASSDNYGLIPQLGEKAAGLKMYLNETFTTLKLDDISVWMKVIYGLRRVKICLPGL